MSSPIFQSTNILDNFYTDGNFNYVLSSTINLFPDIVSYCMQTIPTYCPNYSNPDNKLIYNNNNNLYEINFYKNIIILIPIIITTYQTFESEIQYIKTYLETFIQMQENKNNKILNLINTKLIIYSPYSLSMSSSFNFNLCKVSNTVINTKLNEPMFESFPITINNNYLNTNINFITPINSPINSINNSTMSNLSNQPQKQLKQKQLSFDYTQPMNWV